MFLCFVFRLTLDYCYLLLVAVIWLFDLTDRCCFVFVWIFRLLWWVWLLICITASCLWRTRLVALLFSCNSCLSVFVWFGSCLDCFACVLC